MKITTFWEKAPCSRVEVDISEACTAFIIRVMNHCGAGGSMHLW
jgi:hypothetical protein